MFEICYSLWYGAVALSGKAGSERLPFSLRKRRDQVHACMRR